MSRLMYYSMYGLINKGADQTTDGQAGWSAPLLFAYTTVGSLQQGPI